MLLFLGDFLELSFVEEGTSILESFRFVNVYSITAASFFCYPLRLSVAPIHRQDNIGLLHYLQIGDTSGRSGQSISLH